jgi:hypothetical protein
MFAKFGDAMKDVAETIRRVYQDPPARQVPLGFPLHSQPPFSAMEAPVQLGLAPFSPRLGDQRLQPEVQSDGAGMALEAKLKGEGTWASWAAGARVAVMGVFEAKATGRIAVPPLPRKPAVGAIAAGAFPVRTLRAFDGIPWPRARSADSGLAAPPTRKDLDLLLSLPVGILGEDLRTAPRPVQMRCSLEIVKATGENVRNLDLLGRYRIPKKGVREIRHDAASGRLLVLLGAEAAGSGHALLLIARRKEDHSLLTCYAEEPG